MGAMDEKGLAAAVDCWMSFVPPDRPDITNDEAMVEYVATENVRAVVSAYLSAAAQPVPGVKELEWQEIHQRRSDEDPTTEVVGWEAEASGFACSYIVELTGGGASMRDPDYEERQFSDPVAAKAAAQADFAARIRSALLPTPAGESEREPVGYDPKLVAELLAADAATPEAEFDNATDMLAALAIPSSPAAWTDEAIIELAVAHSNYRDEAGFEVMSHARIIEFARELLAAPTAIPSTGTDEPARSIPAEPTVRMSAAGMRVIKDTEVDHFHKYAGGIANSVYDAMVRAFREEPEHMGQTPASKEGGK